MMQWLSGTADWAGYAGLILLQFIGLALNLLGMPGLWLMVASLAVYGWITGLGKYVGWESIVAVFVLAVIAELIEFAAGAVGSRAVGGSKRGMAGAVVGGLMGAILATPFLPPLGTILGAVAGCFAGAFLVERGIGRGTTESVRIGAGAAAGRLVGIITKTGVGLVILAISLYAAFGQDGG